MKRGDRPIDALQRILFILLMFTESLALSQENPGEKPGEDHPFFDGLVLEEEDDAMAAELKEMLDRWLEHPLNVNSDDPSQLADYGLISILQWNKLKEYRLKYGNLLSTYELKNIDGWNPDLARKMAPYLTADEQPEEISFSTPYRRKISQQLVLKSGLSLEQRKGYRVQDGLQPYYLGPPLRLSVRYDLKAGNHLESGFRLEKDQGEPWLIRQETFHIGYRYADHFSAYMKLNFNGLIKTIVLGDFRMTFGYGLNYSGGNMISGPREGLTYPAHRIRANTSMSESGYLRGTAVYLQSGQFGLTCFASYNQLDGTSIETDSASGRPVSFSSVDASGLHRTALEISQRKAISEQIYGGHLVFMNNWMKAGLISYFNALSIPIRPKNEPYAKFRFSGTSNQVTGLTWAVWLRKIRFATEISVSRNRATALIAGGEFIPLNGIAMSLIYRHFDLKYRNLHGAGFGSGGNNDNESGIQAMIRLETASKWLISLLGDVSLNRWVTYRLDAPSRRWYAMCSAERTWRDQGALYLSVKYTRETANSSGTYSRICHPVFSSKASFRLEGRAVALKRCTFKTRLEATLYKPGAPDYVSGWLILQDIGYTPQHLPVHIWARICLFESEAYETRLYAYENDVLYDFSSFMHDGKGLRAVLMLKYSPWNWLDCWLRLASVSYTDRSVISSGWDEVEGNRLEEMELQLRFRM